jgi:predicted DNA-binding transcriptional regulator YafY
MTEKKLKKRIQRCLGILTTVLSRKGIDRNVLAAEYQCSTRQISDDLNLLREIGFPICYERQSGYTLSVADLPIPSLPLNQEHILSMFIASQLLVLTPLEQQADEAVQNMLSGLSEDSRNFLRNLTDRVYIAPEGELGENSRILFDVYRAVSECRSVQIAYSSFSQKKEEELMVDPYGIYIKDRAQSYMVGFSYGRDQRIRRFKLCRISRLSFRGIQFGYPSDFSMRDEMGNGFWSGEQEYHVQIRIHAKIAQLVREREAAEQIEELPGGFLLFRRTVRNLQEVLWDILRYGSGAEVLEPKELRDMMAHEIMQMAKIYREDRINETS